MNIKGLIFDMDGVLIETEKYHYQAWKASFETKDINLSPADYSKYCQAQGRRNAIVNILKTPSEEDIKVLSDIKASAYKEAIDSEEIDLYPDAAKLLQFLENRQHILLTIGSSSVVADYVIQKTYIAWQFGHIYTGNMVNRNKPYPDLFDLAAKDMDIRKENLAVIEDSIAGVIAACLAGIKVFALNRDNSLQGLDFQHIQNNIIDLGLELTEQEIANLSKASIFPIDDLTQVITFL